MSHYHHLPCFLVADKSLQTSKRLNCWEEVVENDKRFVVLVNLKRIKNINTLTSQFSYGFKQLNILRTFSEIY